ncbi:hypothetical protein TRICI_003573 [Trichomonascus ciferrii]|uniref:Major facilitator superfamily (MFS) profile domain-containing protein n=1 Tax=Trichomonascus ciferrii TaxID=44093 RepID=A0A642V3N6_9ASCO|nr:hypothetical protein TRICI_003573 [Trichomonascus ciferrii]
MSEAVEQSRKPEDDVDVDVKSLEAGEELVSPPKPYKLGPISIPHYHSTYFQVFLVGFVNFLSVGMYNVLISLGGSGQLDPTTSENANTILYALFAFVALLSGSITNYFGPRITLSIGALGFALYGASFWSFNHNQNKGFVLFAGAACGVGAGLLWTACGTILMSYPTESQKGRFVSIFFALSFLGSVVGGIIPVAENFSNKSVGAVSDGTYAALTVLMILSGVVSLFLVNPDKIIRTDGTRVQNADRKRVSLVREFKTLYWAVNKERWILWFLPFAFSCLFYISYQTNDFNSYFFNVRTRSVNGLLYGISQLLGAVFLGIFLDIPFLERKYRAMIGWGIMLTTIFVVSICGYFPMTHSQRDVPFDPPLDLKDGAVATKYMTLYFFYGMQDGMAQGFSFWLMGSLSNDPLVLSQYSGLFKVFGATASAIAFGMDGRGIPYSHMYAAYWSVSLFGCLCLIPLIFFRVNNHTTSTILEPDS